MRKKTTGSNGSGLDPAKSGTNKSGTNKSGTNKSGTNKSGTNGAHVTDVTKGRSG
jgi:hypothetical protein